MGDQHITLHLDSVPISASTCSIRMQSIMTIG